MLTTLGAFAKGIFTQQNVICGISGIIFRHFLKKSDHFVTYISTESLFRENSMHVKVVEKNYHFLNFRGLWKSSFFEKVIKDPFFRKCIGVTQNGHFFSKNVEK